MEHGDGPTTESVQEFVDALAEPVVVLDRHLDVVAANRIAGSVSASLTVGTNLARFTFLNPYVEESADDWEDSAHRTAAMLRDSLEQHDEDPRFRELVGELMARSPAFASEWAAGGDEPARRGLTTFENPLVGRVVLRWEQLRRPDDHEHVLVVWVPVDEASAHGLEALRDLLRGEPES
ncbi:hypothetical protein EDF64_11740 [Curtobacterium flaccumfaciens]|uniref:MmyB-like transcription regulator ligand binding domain-containing protein n=1 Tax=Curtobacterium flaccumfaciens TaxID=2035 RepID=A0A4R6DBG3_9MICO|nr:hypothetical protein [Curtobacterium flaccumfaciens]TDN41643.1 hypothetical protein EDF64_11740 [Curtobacterium flaccumfaciens]